MIAQFFNTTIVILLVVLVAVPATLAVARTLKERSARRRLARERDRRTGLEAGQGDSTRSGGPRPVPAAAGSPRSGLRSQIQRPSTQVYRRLSTGVQDARRTKPGDRVPSRSETPPRG